MSDRNASKRRRAAQNKAARDALVARRTKVQDRPATTDRNPTPGAGSTASATVRAKRRLGRRPVSTADATTGRPSRAAVSPSPRTTGADRRGDRTGNRPVREPKTALGRAFVGVQQAPGGRAVLFGFLFSIAAAGMLLFAPITPHFVQRVPSQIVNEVRTTKHLPISAATRTALQKPRVESTYLTSQIGPLAGVVTLPVLIAGAAVLAARRPGRTRTFTFAAVGLLLFVVLLSSVGIFFLFSGGALGFGAYQSRKADGPATRRARRSRRRPGDGSENAGVEDDDDDG